MKTHPLILTAALTLAACASAPDETPLTTPTPAPEAPEPTSTPAPRPPTSTHWKATLRLSTPAMLTTSLSHIPVMPCC